MMGFNSASEISVVTPELVHSDERGYGEVTFWFFCGFQNLNTDEKTNDSSCFKLVRRQIAMHS